MNAWRMLARGCGSVFFTVFLSAALSFATAVRGQEAAPQADGPALADQQGIDEMLERVMQTPTSVEFADTPLREAIDFLAGRADMNFVFDLKALTDAGVETDVPVTLDVRDLRLESVLALLLDDLDLTWVYRHEVVMITSKAENDSLLTTRVYRVDDLLKQMGSAYSPDLVIAIQQVSRTDWDDMGGPAVAQMLGGALLVSATRSMHADVRRLLDDLRRAYGLDAPPAEVDGPNPALLAALRKRLDFNFEATPLVDVCKILTEQSGAPILLDDKALTDAGVTTDTQITFHARDITLRSALKLLLSEMDLTWVIRHDVLMVTSKAEAESFGTVRVYPLGNLADNSQQAERVRQFIKETIAPESWDNESGPGSMAILPGLLVVSQTDDLHEEIAGVLARLRARGSLWQEAEGMPGYDGYRRVVYRVSKLSPDDVASAIKATVAPESWRSGQGNIQVIRAAAAPRRAAAGSSPAKAQPEPPSPDAPSATQDAAPVDAAPSPATGQLIVVQRSDAHDEIAKLLRELNAAIAGDEAPGSPRPGGGGFFRAP